MKNQTFLLLDPDVPIREKEEEEKQREKYMFISVCYAVIFATNIKMYPPLKNVKNTTQEIAHSLILTVATERPIC